MGLSTALFLFHFAIRECQGSNYTITKPDEKVNDLIEKTTDFAMTGNNTAQTALDKLNTVFAKNKGLNSCAKIIRGEGVSDPVQVGVYSLAPCTSVDV